MSKTLTPEFRTINGRITSKTLGVCRGMLGVLMIELLLCLAAQAQASHQVSLNGYVLPAFRLEAGQPATGPAVVEAHAWERRPNEVIVEVTVRRAGEAATVNVPLRLRTNAEHFALWATYQGPATEGSLWLGSPQASGDGHLVESEALATFQALPTPLAMEMVLARGSRISRRGSFRSPHNALESTLTISLATQTTEEAQTFRFFLQLGN